MTGVVMLVNEFPPISMGGAERQAERLSARLAAQGLAVGVITRGAPGLPDYETRDGFWIARLARRLPGKLQTAAFLLGALAVLWRRRAEYQIIHAHLAFAPALAAALMGRLLQRAVVVKFGNSGPFGDVAVSQRTGRGRLRLAVLRRLADAVVVLDQAMQAEVLAAGFDPARVTRLDNGLDAAAFAGPAERPAGPVNVLYVGRLSPQKALPNLLRAFQQAAAAVPDLRLTLAGDGPDRAALEAEARGLGLAERVTFAGNLPDVRPLLRAAHIFVLPSDSEGISNALLEAMAAGLACVATAVGGTPEVLDYGRAGRLTSPGQVAELAQAIRELALDPAERERLGQAARQRILERYDFTVVGARYQELYQRLLREAAR